MDKNDMLASSTDAAQAVLLLEQALDNAADVLKMIRHTVDKGTELASADELQTVQRQLVLLANSASEGAARLYTLLRRAQQPAATPAGDPA